MAIMVDTLDRLNEAMSLYDTLGFRRVKPYYSNPLPGVVDMELALNEETISRHQTDGK